ncbi:uncharacterized protein LDX57_001059 [Aspergillus melleus]|uniref:uncharacterized protein n=1 Tax=Aspergillus melleus TaxID=138277 RepID=UPI001E8DE009|nr:uncharacterized protein LDX57_001059 [Aspergillus melleus]KAH8423301.1 hypothetical protein LDX57_001059 [Aspergillus melleus]
MAKHGLRKGLKFVKRKLTNKPIAGLPAWVNTHTTHARRQPVYDPPGSEAYTGQTVMIIGAMGALGRRTAYLFVLNGAACIHLTGKCRDELAKLEYDLRNDHHLHTANPGCRFILHELDLSNRGMTRDFVKRITTDCPHLHVLLFNAATFCPGFQGCDGPDDASEATERMMQVNCYSQCLIFMALRKILSDTGRDSGSLSHVTFVTCHWLGNGYGTQLPDSVSNLRARLANRITFNSGHQFHLSKLLTTFWVYYYASLAPVDETHVVVNTVWPGTLKHSNIYREWGPEVHQATEEARALFGRPIGRAARVVHAATRGNAGTHGHCIANKTKYLGQNLVTQHARLGCERLVYRMIEQVMRREITTINDQMDSTEFQMVLDTPHDSDEDEPVVDNPWQPTLG